MKTAEEIIQEYLARGYGPESLRILAESREEPLGGQMLEILDRLELPAAREESGMAEVACDEAVFFVADDDGAADGESVDFDLMAETRAEIPEAGEAPAEDGESVADIVIGETDGADMVAYKTEAVEPVEPEEPAENEMLSVVSESAETGIWSRLWSRTGQAAPALSPSMAEEQEMAAAPEVASEPVDEESAEEPVVEIAVMEEPAPEATAASAEISADYIPGSAAEPFEPEDAAEEIVEENVAEQPAAEMAEEPAAEEEAQAEPVAEAEAEQPVENKVGRREKRRRDRLEKKKARRGRKNAADELPGIVLTQSEESGTLIPEAAEIVEPVEPAEAAGTAVPEPEEPVAAEAEEKCEPLVAPGVLAALSVHSFAFAASLAAMSRSELAKAAVIAKSIEQDRLAAMAVEQNNMEAALENDPEAAFAQDSAEENAEAFDGGESSVENNVILFRDKFPVFAGGSGDEEETDEAEDSPLALLDNEESACFEPFLRMLSAPESDETGVAESAEIAEELPETIEEIQDEAPEAAEEPVMEETAPEAAPPVEEEVAQFEESGPEPAEPAAPAESPASEQEQESASLASLLERETELRRQLEEEYQTRLDTFAARLLEAQAAAAAHENRAAEKKAELDARCAVLEEMRKRLEGGEEKQRELLGKLDETSAALRSRDGELAECTKTHEGLRGEHARLYREFEDLRRAYNEVVTDVMPALQGERDDLAMTVERQCAKEQTLRTSLNSSRKRLAAGYILGAAACLMLVTLPVANWLRSGEDNRKLAVDHQLFSELRETLDAQVRQNVDAQTRIVELERKITRARDEISRLDGRNKELAGLAAAQHSQGIAVFKPEDASASGTPTRAMTMALQATVPPGGKLHVNEVMDPAGSIEQLAMENSARNPGPYGIPARAGETRMAQAAANAGTALPVSALARTDAGSSGSLRPQAQTQGRAAARPAAAPASGLATVTAKVKKGEGVAQVVYRVLNTRDPDVISWVIAENKIRNDRRGNPLIQPNQELRLPKDGRIGQAASAAGVKRR